MAQTIGVVIEINGDGQATVVAEKGQGCGSCSAVSQCQGGRASHSQQTPALNRAGAVVGDRVMLTVESGDILSRLALLYLVPVFGMLTGAFTGAFMYRGCGWNRWRLQRCLRSGGICPWICVLRCHFPDLVGDPAGHAGHHPNRQHQVCFLVYPPVGRMWL